MNATNDIVNDDYYDNDGYNKTWCAIVIKRVIL